MPRNQDLRNKLVDWSCQTVVDSMVGSILRIQLLLGCVDAHLNLNQF